jgi:hypothetical protein
MPKVGGIFRQAHLTPQRTPVIDNFIDAACPEAGQIVHQRIGPSGAIRTFTAMTQDNVVVAQNARLAQTACEPLDESAVDAVVPHPDKVSKHGGSFKRTENLRHTAVGIPKLRGKTFI